MTKHLNVFMKLYLIYVRKRNAVIPLNTDNNIRNNDGFIYFLGKAIF